MKNIIYLLAILFVITSCSEENEDPTSILIGTWLFSDFTADCSENEEPISINMGEGCMSINGDQRCLSLKFEDNGTGQIIFGKNDDQDIITINYVLNVNLLSLCNEGDCDEAILRDGLIIIGDREEGCDEEYVFSKR